MVFLPLSQQSGIDDDNKNPENPQILDFLNRKCSLPNPQFASAVAVEQMDSSRKTIDRLFKVADTRNGR